MKFPRNDRQAYGEIVKGYRAQNFEYYAEQPAKKTSNLFWIVFIIAIILPVVFMFI